MADEKAAAPAAADGRPEVAVAAAAAASVVAAAEGRAETVRCSTLSAPLVARTPKCRFVRAATVMSSVQTASAANAAAAAVVVVAADAATAGS